MQLLPNVFLVSGFAYGVHPNVYAVKGENGIVLVDTGLDSVDLSIIDQNLEDWELATYPVTHVLLTHSHFDHSGNAHVFSERGAMVVCGPSDADGVELGDERTISYAYDQDFPPCKVNVRIQDKDVIEANGLKFEVIHTPGHSYGSVFYKLRIGGKLVVFSGDSVMVGSDYKSGMLGVPLAIDYDPQAYLSSLLRISKIQCDVLLPGHFQPCLQKASKVLKDAFKEGLIQLRK